MEMAPLWPPIPRYSQLFPYAPPGLVRSSGAITNRPYCVRTGKSRAVGVVVVSQAPELPPRPPLGLLPKDQIRAAQTWTGNKRRASRVGMPLAGSHGHTEPHVHMNRPVETDHGPK